MYYNGKAVKKKPDKRKVNGKRNEKSEKRSWQSQKGVIDWMSCRERRQSTLKTKQYKTTSKEWVKKRSLFEREGKKRKKS